MTSSDPESRPDSSDLPPVEASRPSDGPGDRRTRLFRIVFLWLSLALLFVIVWTFLGPVR